MLQKINRLLDNRRFVATIEISVSIIITLLALLDVFSFLDVVTSFLMFMVILEVIRMVREFINSKSVKISIVIDSFIIFFIRDVVLIASSTKYSFEEQVIKSAYIISIVIILFVLRILSLKYSPNDKNCESCPAMPNFYNENLFDTSVKKTDTTQTHSSK